MMPHERFQLYLRFKETWQLEADWKKLNWKLTEENQTGTKEHKSQFQSSTFYMFYINEDSTKPD